MKRKFDPERKFADMLFWGGAGDVVVLHLSCNTNNQSASEHHLLMVSVDRKEKQVCDWLLSNRQVLNGVCTPRTLRFSKPFVHVDSEEFCELVSSCNADCAETGVCRTHLLADYLPRRHMDGYYVLYLDHDGGEDCVRFAINQLREFCETGLADDHFLYVQSMGYCANTITPGNKIDHFAIHCFDSLMNKYQKVVIGNCVQMDRLKCSAARS